MEIRLTNAHAFCSGLVEREYAWLTDYLVIRTPRFTRERGSGRVSYDGEDLLHLFDHDQEAFPTGFVPQVVRRGREAGFTVNVQDARVCPALPDYTADLAWLRDYQAYCVDAACDMKRGIIQGATGSGKTEIICALIRAFPTLRFLILVHRAQLMSDIRKRIVKRSIEHGYGEPDDVGLYGEGHKQLDKRVTIATFQSLTANKKNPAVKELLDRTEACIVDEAHTVAAGTFAATMERIPSAYYRWGVSGTPLDRGDKKSNITVGLIGPVIARVTARELIDQNVLARPLVRFVKFDARDVYAATWHQVRMAGIAGCPARNQAVLSAVRRARKPCLLFVDLIDHGKFLTQQLQKGGINAAFVWGDKKTHEREAALENLVRGELDVVVTSPVFNEGIDVPSLCSVVMAAGGKSVIATLQRIGRGMRRTEDKDTFEIWDFEDTHHRMLEDHMALRKRAYRREGHEVVLDSECLKLPPVRAAS